MCNKEKRGRRREKEGGREIREGREEKRSGKGKRPLGGRSKGLEFPAISCLRIGTSAVSFSPPPPLFSFLKTIEGKIDKQKKESTEAEEREEEDNLQIGHLFPVT